VSKAAFLSLGHNKQGADYIFAKTDLSMTMESRQGLLLVVGNKGMFRRAIRSASSTEQGKQTAM